jgi:hypothetical protein
VIGGLGVSGDTACADHAIAFRMRHLASLDATPTDDNIVYLGNGELPHDVDHPHCYLSRLRSLGQQAGAGTRASY